MSRSEGPRKLMVTGAGPCRIGQGREYDNFSYQVLSVLAEKGIRAVTISDDPVSILTDPDLLCSVYVEPLTMETVEKVFALERPDGMLQVLGDQNTINLTVFSDREGILDRYGIKVFGSSPGSLMKAEDRELLTATLRSLPVRMAEGRLVTTLAESVRVARDLTYPVFLRPLFAPKGIGGFISYNMEETKTLAARAFGLSPVGEVVVEKALVGWKEIEFEVLRDASGKTAALASFENLDPLGIHTGDSLSVYPFQTVQRRVVEELRILSQDIVQALDIIGCANIQYGFDPESRESVLVDVSPGLTRDAALLSGATGLRLADMATRLALGDSLEDLLGPDREAALKDLETGGHFFALKVPCFAAEMLSDSNLALNASMKSIGNSLSFGASFKEAFVKGTWPLRSRGGSLLDRVDPREIVQHIAIPSPWRVLYIQEAFRQGMELDEIHALTRIDRFYLKHLLELTVQESKIRQNLRESIDQGDEKRISSALSKAKEVGFYDSDIARLIGTSTEVFTRTRHQSGALPRFRFVGVGKGEIEPKTRAFLTYGKKQDVLPSRKKGKTRILVLGGGTIHPPLGSEVDDSCASALRVIREEGHEVVLLDNCPETVRFFDGLYDRAYVEPLNQETLGRILSMEEPEGVITQFGGDISLSQSSWVEGSGYRVLGTPVSSLQTVMDLDLQARFLDGLGLTFPSTKLVVDPEEVLVKSRTLGFPLIMTARGRHGAALSRILYDEENLQRFMASGITISPASPVILKEFSENAIRFEVNALADGRAVFVGPIIEHIEGTSISPMDSTWVLPSLTVDLEISDKVRTNTIRMAQGLEIQGLLNVHYYLKDEELGVLEIHPRVSDTLAFTSRILGIPLAKAAAKLVLGKSLRQVGLSHEVEPSSIAVKQAVLPLDRFPEIDPVLGPQPRSTGQVMGIGETFGSAFAKSQISIGQPLPLEGKAFISVRNQDKRPIVFIAAKLLDLGFSLIATEGTAKALGRHGLRVESVYKIAEGRPDVVDLIKNGEIHLIINTPRGERPRRDLMEIRSQAVANGVPCITTLSGASAAVFGIQDLKRKPLEPKGLKEYQPAGPILKVS
ncbi:MAG: carbamoyl-phosphate synthase large subunit [Deltaproteobacteria bacterium]|nr:carbamoyl-phosphate synthase large subunit [Deltaproteobacteria bacterium]